ncbi:zinc finger/binuclear cluster transcriptional regulator [Favolaschia claudopus]|uniref:Zinc finger/binuclear cluster transcriptional regulator n=1 Tax=Favolaschia claudopus TaxID=2862362 RepID=A0AAW0DVY2_9AGAR
MSRDTGDRPYKCQHCGDQFARSDLLSRHVNKCHAAEKAAGGTASAPATGRRKGHTAATRATTSKQACDQCVQSSLPCDGSNPCAKCVARKTRCTFVKFHRQTAPVGPGHPSSLSASLPSQTSHHPANHQFGGGGVTSGGGIGHLADGVAGGVGVGVGGGHGHQPFLYAQQAAGGGGFAFSAGDRFAHHPDRGDGSPTSASGMSFLSLPLSYSSPRFLTNISTLPLFAGNHYPYPPSSSASASSTSSHSHHSHPGSAYAYRDGSGYSDGGYEYDYEYADSEHSGTGSRPPSSAGLEYGYLPPVNGRGGPLDIHPDMQRPPEFSSAFGLMSLDDPNVLAGLSQDGVPFFSGRTGLTPGAGVNAGPLPPLHHLRRNSLQNLHQLVPPPPLQYDYSGAHPQSHSPPPPNSAHSHTGAMPQPPGAQTPGSREAETRELREFWKAYMRTPLTGPPGQDALGLQTPSASTGAAGSTVGMLGAGMVGATPTRESVNGGRRYRVASLPSVKTPEGEMDAAPVYPIHHHGHGHQLQLPHLQHLMQGQQQHVPPPPPLGRTMHNADDLRSYEAAVLARKAPELVLRKPARRPTTSAGTTTTGSSASPPNVPAQQQQQSPPQQHRSPPPPPMFEFGALDRERGGSLESQGAAAQGTTSQSQSSLAGAFGFAQPFPAAAGSSLPGSPFPTTPNSGASASASASASEDGDSGESGGDAARPSFKRLASGEGAAAAAERQCVSGSTDDCVEGAACWGAAAEEGEEAERACVAYCAREGRKEELDR